jgi:phosphoribosyl 1,2-cyclic phosphodiesterase
VRVELCGVRGSTPAPGREFEHYGGHTSCIVLSSEDGPASLILDAGTGIRGASGLLGGRAFAGTILLTHLHWDHIQGLPFFAAGDREDSEVHVVLPEQADSADALAVLSRAMSPPFFPVAPDQLRGSWSFESLAPGVSTRGGFEVLALEIPHKGGRTFGYRVSDGRATITYMPDHCPTALGPGADGYGEYHAAALELATGSDLVVHDAQLLASELGAEAWMGHSCGEYAVELARRAGARGVLLFHHGRDRTDEQLRSLGESFAGAPPVTVARQGDTLQL